jgi:hypothetical protein
MRAVLLGEEHIVVLVAFEGGIQVEQVDGLVLQVAPENIEIVTVVEEVLTHKKTSGAPGRINPIARLEAMSTTLCSCPLASQLPLIP